MKYRECVEACQNLNETRRIASAYVEDCRRLDIDELKASLLKTEGQYISFDNIKKQLDALKLHENPMVRIITPIFLQNYLIDADRFISPCKITEEEIINYEQKIIDESNNVDFKKISKDYKDFALLKRVLDKAWEHDDRISVDEKNLIEVIRIYLHITVDEQNMLEAKSGRYPTKGNVLHKRDEIDLVRKVLQGAGLIFYVKNQDGVPMDVIPKEIALEIRKYYGIEIRRYAYEQLFADLIKKTKKQYLIDIIGKFNDNPDTSYIDISSNPTIPFLRDIILKNIKPSNLLGGFSAKDGLDKSVLYKWCLDLGLNVSGAKEQLIKRLLDHYDEKPEIIISTDDEREVYYKFYKELACRDLTTLRENKVIKKDLECEHYFEKATDYLFEKLLCNKPLELTGTEHPDGKLSYNDRYILWDNKSKETPVNLQDHMAQFNRYITSIQDKPVSVFMVIGPSFTDNSVKECVKYSLSNDTQILLITAEELKEVAEEWNKKHPKEIFNLGYFKQSGRFDKFRVIF